MTSPTPRRVRVLLVVAGVLLSGCNATSDTDGSARTTSRGSGAQASGTTPATAPGSPPEAAVPTLSPFWVVDKVVVPGQARPIPPGVDPPRAALDALIARPNDLEKGAGFTTGLQTNVSINNYFVVGDIATVDFSRTFETHDTHPQVVQVVYTLTQFEEITKVQFLIEGETNGATGVPPMGRADVADMAPPALIDVPTIGTTFTGGKVKVSGTVDARVAKITWKLEGVDGPPLAEGTLEPKKQSGDTTRAKFFAVLDVPPPTIYAGPAFLTIDASILGRAPLRIPIFLA